MLGGSKDGSTEMVLIGGSRSWQEIDRNLRTIAKRQRALDAEEAALLCIASRVRIWEELARRRCSSTSRTSSGTPRRSRTNVFGSRSAMATAILEGGGAPDRVAKFQIRITRCDDCKHTFQEGGRKIAIQPR
jgi:hypothetical protein